MARILTSANMQRDPIALARLHTVLRFSTGITLAFVICEAMGWYPTFLAPVLLGALLTSLPSSPPLKTGVMLVAVMAAAALVAFILPSLLRETPEVMVGAIGYRGVWAVKRERRVRRPAVHSARGWKPPRSS